MILLAVLTGCLPGGDATIPAGDFIEVPTNQPDAAAVGGIYPLQLVLPSADQPFSIEVAPAGEVEVLSITQDDTWVEAKLRAAEEVDATVTVMSEGEELHTREIAFRTPDRVEFHHLVDVVRYAEQPVQGPVLTVRGGQVGAEMVAWSGERIVRYLPVADSDEEGLDVSWGANGHRSFVRVAVQKSGVVPGSAAYPELGGWQIDVVPDQDVERLEVLANAREPGPEDPSAVVLVGWTAQGERVQGIPARWRNDGQRMKPRADAFLLDPGQAGERDVSARWNGLEASFQAPMGGSPVWSSSTCSSAGNGMGWAGVFLGLLGLLRRQRAA